MSPSAPAPQLAANKVLDDISSFAAKRIAPDAFTYKRLEREAKSSLQQDASVAYTALGALNAVSGKEELMHKYHKMAIDCRDDFLSRNNYATSLQLMSRLSEAAEQCRLLVSKDAGNLKSLVNAINYTWQSGEISKAASLTNMYNKLVPNDHDKYQNLMSANNLQQKLEITDEQVSHLTRIACDYLRKHGIPIIGGELGIDADTDYETLSLSLLLDMPNQDIWAHNRKLFEIMMDEVPEQSAHLSVRLDRAHFA
jgi:hypothetical protein